MPTAAARLRTRIAALAATALAALAVSACDSSSGPTLRPDSDTRQVTVVGAGQVQGTPDTLTVDACRSRHTAPDVTTAMNQTSDRTSRP